MEIITQETHPFKPFLPPNAKLLMLGSFPPQRKRWAMEFYYPNLINDMWRIMGLIFFDNKDYLLTENKKSFRQEPILELLNEKGIALFDTATVIRRLQDNASDKFLEVVQATDVRELLNQIPLCRAIAATGQKATDTLCLQFDVKEPCVSGSSSFTYSNCPMKLYRMPSTSRAYPLKLEQKAIAYRTMFEELQIL